MARRRMIDPNIWEDPSFNSLSVQARLLFIGMISQADDDGRLRGDAGSVKRLILGFDEVSKADVAGFLQEIQDHVTNIHFYEDNGETYAHFTNWEVYQNQRDDRRQPSLLPVCTKCQPTVNQVSAVVGQMPAEVKLSKDKGSKEKISEVKGSVKGNPVAPPPSAPGPQKDFKSLKAFAVGVFLLFLLARSSHASTVEVTYTISTSTTHSTSPRQAVKPRSTVSVEKQAGESARRAENTSYLPQTETEIINATENAQLVRHIYAHESGSGRADICRSMGKFNGFGYNEWPGHRPTCYSTFQEVVGHVNQWIKSRKDEGFTLAEMSCYYIRGLRTENCQSGYKFQ